MGDQHTIARKIDGLFILSNDLCILKPRSTVNINLPILGKLHTCDTYIKGSRVLQEYRQVCSVPLSFINGLSTNIIFYGDAELQKGRLNKAVMHALQSSLELMLNDQRETGIRWHESLNMNFKPQRGKIVVYASDFATFATKFRHCIQSEISTEGLEEGQSDEVHFKILLKDSGQSMGMDQYLHGILGVNFQMASEIMLHIATDITEPGKFLGWKRQELIARVGDQPSREFYPDALYGVGNFYFLFPDLSVGDSSPNSEGFDAEVKITQIKCYSQNHKYVHLNKPPPFKRSVIGQFIWLWCCNSLLHQTEAHKARTRRSLRIFETHLNLVPRLAVLRTSVYARCEVIVSITGDASLRDGCNFARQFLRRNQLLEGTLQTMDIDTIAARRAKYMLPAMNTLRKYIQQVHSYLDGINLDIINIGLDDCLTMKAAEALLCFFIYGCAERSFCWDVGHDTRLCTDMQLTKGKLMKSPFRDGRLGPDFGARRRSHEGQIIRTLRFDDELHYYPSIDVGDTFDRNAIANSTKFSKILEVCSDFDKDSNDGKLHEMFLNILMYTALSFIKGSGYRPNPRDLKLHMTCRYEGKFANTNVKTSYEFTRWLFNLSQGQAGGLLGVKFVLGIIENSLAYKFDLWKTAFSHYLDNQMYAEKFCLIFPNPHGNSQIVVMPVNMCEQARSGYFIMYAFQKRYKTIKIKTKDATVVHGCLSQIGHTALGRLNLEELMHSMAVQLRVVKQIENEAVEAFLNGC